MPFLALYSINNPIDSNAPATKNTIPRLKI